MPGGRPSTYTPEAADDICQRVAMGENIYSICKRDDGPAERTVYQWLRANPEFAQNYARARELRADKRSDRIDDIVRRVLDGEVDPQSARVAIDAEKWQAGKENPRRYGDKVDLNVGGQNGDNPLVTEVRRTIVDPAKDGD